MGKCPDCGKWETLEPQRVEAKAKTDPRAASLATWTGLGARASAAVTAADARAADDTPPSKLDAELAAEMHSLSPVPGGGSIDPAAGAGNGARPMSDVLPEGGSGPLPRLSTGMDELDRVLGGGVVPGSAVLLGGDPGIGKSTLLLQAAHALAARGHPTLYVSSEESAEQIRLRAARLLPAWGPGELEAEPKSADGSPRAGPSARASRSARGAADRLFLLSETSLSRIIDQAARVLGREQAGEGPAAGAGGSKPGVIIIDSVQMIYKAELDAYPGSITQLRRCCAELVYMAKASGTAVILVGHVTKDGALAGPRLLEHLVDAVLYFEGDRHHAHRIVRAVKNRFGSTLELGIFEMTGAGLRPAPQGAGLVAAAAGESRPGTVVCPVLTGTRCLMVEIQALTATGFLGAAKRKSSGLGSDRLAMLIAVLEQHAGLRLADRDVFASVVGGIRVAEPAADLALLLAIAGANAKRATPAACVAVGEVGLAGEVRSVTQIEQRLREAARLGFARAMVPRLPKGVRAVDIPLELAQVATVGEAIDRLM